MHRRPLLDALRRYAGAHPDEHATLDRFVRFVELEARCFERSFETGHVTGSAWVLNANHSQVLLTHHRKLDRWLQLGGHADGDPNVLAVALREAQEESGLEDFEVVGDGIFDIDIHPIPARAEAARHLHYDVRYILRTAGSTDYRVSDESHDLRWVPLDEVSTLTGEESMLRMVRKCRSRFGAR